MNVRLVVGGLLTRNAVLNELLWNYADRLERDGSANCPGSAPRFIVPVWSDDQPPSGPFGGRLFAVQAHTSRTDPGRHDTLDAILRLLHTVLTDDHASSFITARRLSTSTEVVAGDLDTVVRSGIWDIAPAPSGHHEAARRRLLPWPDCSTSIMATGALAPASSYMN